MEGRQERRVRGDRLEAHVVPDSAIAAGEEIVEVAVPVEVMSGAANLHKS